MSPLNDSFSADSAIPSSRVTACAIQSKIHLMLYGITVTKMGAGDALWLQHLLKEALGNTYYNRKVSDTRVRRHGGDEVVISAGSRVPDLALSTMECSQLITEIGNRVHEGKVWNDLDETSLTARDLDLVRHCLYAPECVPWDMRLMTLRNLFDDHRQELFNECHPWGTCHDLEINEVASFKPIVRETPLTRVVLTLHWRGMVTQNGLTQLEFLFDPQTESLVHRSLLETNGSTNEQVKSMAWKGATVAASVLFGLPMIGED